MEYTLNSPMDHMTGRQASKEEFIDMIVNRCNDLAANEKLIVYGFGEDRDLVMAIYKDEEFDPDVDKDYSNLVDIHTCQNGQYVDDAVGIYVTDGELFKELNRIWHYYEFETL